MIKQYHIKLPHFKRGFHLITGLIKENIETLPETGILHIFIQHTSAALTLNENADPDVARDLNYAFNKLVPENDPGFIHTIEGPDDMPAHIKSSILSSSLTIPITDGRLDLGTWQGVFLCEFRNNGGSRKIVVTVYS
jgi:secondary thiamine-phosphate synthase enzyme